MKTTNTPDNQQNQRPTRFTMPRIGGLVMLAGALPFLISTCSAISLSTFFTDNYYAQLGDFSPYGFTYSLVVALGIAVAAWAITGPKQYEDDNKTETKEYKAFKIFAISTAVVGTVAILAETLTCTILYNMTAPTRGFFGHTNKAFGTIGRFVGSFLQPLVGMGSAYSDYESLIPTGRLLTALGFDPMQSSLTLGQTSACFDMAFLAAGLLAGAIIICCDDKISASIKDFFKPKPMQII